MIGAIIFETTFKKSIYTISDEIRNQFISVQQIAISFEKWLMAPDLLYVTKLTP